MIGKAKSNKSLQATLTYNVKGKANLIYTNRLVGLSLDDYRMEMGDLQKCYRGYGKQLTIHAILSPAIEDGKKLSLEQWQAMSDKYLEKMGMKGLQAVGFLHADKEHGHLHLVINKVRENDFKLHHDSYIGKKSHKAADTIAKEMRLVRAMKLRDERLRKETDTIVAEEKIAGSKQKFKHVLASLVKNNYKNATAYFKALEKEGFIVHQYTDKTSGMLRGYSIERDGTKMDASAIGKQFSLKSLGLKIQQEAVLAESLQFEQAEEMKEKKYLRR